MDDRRVKDRNLKFVCRAGNPATGSLRTIFFFKQKTAYEIDLVTGVQTCALPISLRFVDVCYRCNMTTIDQDKAEFGHEPLQTLGHYRHSSIGVRFGSYAAVADGIGKRLAAGSRLEIELNF